MPTISRPADAGAALLRWAADRAASTSPVLVDLSLEPARVELSGRVLVNWWAKNAGLLAAEWGIGPGSRVAVQAPPHWRVLPLALAALSLGAQLGPARWEDADLLITTTPSSPEAEASPEVLAVTTAALATSFGEPLPAGAVDHAAEVRAYPDRLLARPGEAAAASWEHDGALLGLGELLAGGEDGEGTTLEVPSGAGPLRAVRALLRSGSTGSVVLAPSAGLSDRLRAQERVTHTLEGDERAPWAGVDRPGPA